MPSRRRYWPVVDRPGLPAAPVGKIQQLQQTDPVTEAVMRFEEIGGLTPPPAKYQQSLPRGTFGVEWTGGELRCHGVQFGHRSVIRQSHPLQVIRQVEMGVGRPSGRNQ